MVKVPNEGEDIEMMDASSKVEEEIEVLEEGRTTISTPEEGERLDKIDL